jgi:hypothetical protein
MILCYIALVLSIINFIVVAAYIAYDMRVDSDLEERVNTVERNLTTIALLSRQHDEFLATVKKNAEDAAKSKTAAKELYTRSLRGNT